MQYSNVTLKLVCLFLKKQNKKSYINSSHLYTVNGGHIVLHFKENIAASYPHAWVENNGT